MATIEGPSDERWMLRARETEQLARVADRIRLERHVLAFLSCESAHRGEVLVWLSKAAGRDVPAPAESSALELLARLESAAEQTAQEVESLAWSAGDRDAIAALNLHREKLRRGASVLVWCEPEDLATLQREGQDVYSFRDTLVVITGFSIPEVHVPSDDTPEIRLARARLELPGTEYEKALAAADLATLLLERAYYREAAEMCIAAVQPFLSGDVHDAGRGTIAYLAATLSAALAAIGAVSEARGWAEGTLASLIPTGALTGEDLTVFVDAIEPTAAAPLAAALVLHGATIEVGLEPFQRCVGVSLAEEIARSGQLREWRPKHETFPANAAEPEARGIVALARGDVEEATGSFRIAADHAGHRDEDNRSQMLRAVDGLIAEGDIRCAAPLLGRLRKARSTDWLPLHVKLRTAWVLALARRVEQACRILRFEQRPTSVLDGIVYQRCAALASIVVTAALSMQLRMDRVSDTDSYLTTVLDWLPLPEAGPPPFYRILFPGLRADLLSLLPERRAEAADLARGAWELASAEYPRYAPDHAAKAARCLLTLDRFDDALDALSVAETETESLGNLCALAKLRALRVVAHVGRTDEGKVVDSAMAALRETLDATGSPRIAAENLLFLARGLPTTRMQPDVIALVEESSERFADMPMLAGEELCRETKGDALLARGRREEAAACFAAATRRLRHYGLLLRVPLLQAKHRVALGEEPVPPRDEDLA